MSQTYQKFLEESTNTVKAKKKPVTVGGKTKGRDKMPSTKILLNSFSLRTTHQAASMPKKKTIAIVTIAVFKEIQIGEKSIIISHTHLQSLLKF